MPRVSTERFPASQRVCQYTTGKYAPRPATNCTHWNESVIIQNYNGLSVKGLKTSEETGVEAITPYGGGV